MTLSPRRLFFGTSTALVLIAFLAAMVATGRVRPTNYLSRVAVADSAVARAVTARSDRVRGITLAYGERARLGLGSPFRLMDQAMHDTRLPDSLRLDLAWSIAGQILDGDVYVTDT